VPQQEAGSRLACPAPVPAHPAAAPHRPQQPPHRLTSRRAALLSKQSGAQPSHPHKTPAQVRVLLEGATRPCSHDCCTRNGFEKGMLEML